MKGFNGIKVIQQHHSSWDSGVMMGDLCGWDLEGLPALERRPFDVGPSAIGARWSRLSVLTTRPARSIALIPEPAVIPSPMVPDEELSSPNFRLGVGLPQLDARLGGRKLAVSVSDRRFTSSELRPETIPPRSNSFAPSSRTRS